MRACCCRISVSMALNSQTPCRLFAVGKCKIMDCKFLHGSEEEAMQIPCCSISSNGAKYCPFAGASRACPYGGH